jgi:hypothetical protein
MNMIIDVMRTLTGKTMIDVNDEMTVHNNGLMIKSTIVVNYILPVPKRAIRRNIYLTAGCYPQNKHLPICVY